MSGERWAAQGRTCVASDAPVPSPWRGRRRAGPAFVACPIARAVFLAFFCLTLPVGVTPRSAHAEPAAEAPAKESGAPAPDPLFDDDGADDATAAGDTSDDAGTAEDASGDDADPLFDESFDDDLDAAPATYPDPFERTNRGVLAFNRHVDKWILDPVTEAYQWLVPKGARNAISRFFLNLGSTKTLVNDCLQLEWKDASVTTARLVVNTTAGVVGFFDVAEMIGLPGHESDFGQTLALAGTPSGPYLMLPVLGPSDLRDGFGTVVDGFFQPTYYILGPMNVTLGPIFMQSPTAILLYGGSSGLTLRDRNFARLKDLESSSVDYYAAMRSGFYQDRVGQIWARRPDHRTTHEPGEDAAH
jgi:phospholipid-binding lipoprotein MlaA